MVDKEKILAGRKVVDAYRIDRSNPSTPLPTVSSDLLLDKLISDLRELGFNSIDEFFEANEKASIEERNRCARFEGVCDYCEGRKKGCLTTCYERATKPDAKSPTGRTALVAGVRGDKSIIATHHYWRDYYRSLGIMKKGMVYPIIPGCSIRTRIIEEPKLDWHWK